MLRRTFFLLLAILSLANAPSAYAQDAKLTVALPFAAGISFYPFYVAAENGFFKEEKLDVKLVVANGSADAVQQLASGNADVASASPGPMMSAMLRGAALKAVYITYQTNPFKLLVPEESSIKTLSDLRGKAVGVTTLTGGGSSMTRAMLAEAGLESGAAYRMIEVGRAATAMIALSDKAVDAYVGGPSDVVAMEQRGVKLRDLTPPRYKTLFDDPVIFQTAFIAKNPEVVKAFGRALAKASVWAAAAPEATIDLVGRRFPSEIQKRDYASKFMAQILNVYALPEAARGLWGYNDPDAWQLTMEVLVKQGELKAPVKLADAYTNEFVAAFNAFDAKAVAASASKKP